MNYCDSGTRTAARKTVSAVSLFFMLMTQAAFIALPLIANTQSADADCDLIDGRFCFVAKGSEQPGQLVLLPRSITNTADAAHAIVIPIEHLN